MIALLDLSRKVRCARRPRNHHRPALKGQEIADLVGCSRPKASECLKKLVAEDVVVRERRRLIVDPTKINPNLRS